MKKFVSLLMTLVVTLSMSFSVMTVAAFAEDDTATPAKLFVAVIGADGTSSEVNLLDMTAKSYNFSVINNQGTVKIDKVSGITLQKILKKAGIKMGKKQELDIAAADGKSTILRYDDVYGESRYCFTNADKVAADKGPVTKKVKKKVVPSILSIDEEDGVFSATLNFGQKYVTERNKPAFTGDVTTITVKKAEAMEPWAAPKFKTAKTVYVGDTLEFDIKASDSKSGFIFYTVSKKGTKPTAKSRIYNYAPKIPEINTYTFNKTGTYKVKAVVKGFGKKDSKVVTRTFTVKKAKPADETTDATAM